MRAAPLLLACVVLSSSCRGKLAYAVPKDSAMAAVPVLKGLLQAYRVQNHFGEDAELKLTVDDYGRPWYVNPRKGILGDPLADRAYDMQGAFEDAIWVQKGALVACGSGAIVALDVTEQGGTERKKIVDYPRAGGFCSLFPSPDPTTFYFVFHEPEREKDTLYLARKDRAEVVLSVGKKITAVAGEGQDVFFVLDAGTRVYRKAKKSAGYEGYFDAGEAVTRLAYSKDAGLFLATRAAVGFVGPDAQFRFLKNLVTDIVLHGDELYVRFAGISDVVKVTHVSDFRKKKHAPEDIKWGQFFTES